MIVANRMLEDLEHPYTPLTPRQQMLIDDIRRHALKHKTMGPNFWDKLKKIHELRTFKLPLPGDFI
jgi:hypothetical protein